jgi:hypothetical protein
MNGATAHDQIRPVQRARDAKGLYQAAQNEGLLRHVIWLRGAAG